MNIRQNGKTQAIDPAVVKTHNALFDTWFPMTDLPIPASIKPDIAAIAAKVKPIVVARSKATFNGPVKKTVKLQLTPAGRRILGHRKRTKLTAKGVYRPTADSAATWLKPFLLGG